MLQKRKHFYKSVALTRVCRNVTLSTAATVASGAANSVDVDDDYVTADDAAAAAAAADSFLFLLLLLMKKLLLTA